MNNESLLIALSDVSDKYIQEAMPHKKIVPFKKKMYHTVAAVVVLVLILSGVYTTTAYAKPTSYICMDVNPSIELCLNKWNKVIDVISYNEEALAICNNHSFKNKNYLEAIEELMCDADFKAFCQNDANADLTITIVSDNYKLLEAEIKQCDSFLANHGEVCYADKETAQNAHDNNSSIGKYAAYKELQKYDSEISLDDCNQMTMHELHEEISNHHSEEHSERNTENHNSSTNAHSNHSNNSNNTHHNGHHK